MKTSLHTKSIWHLFFQSLLADCICYKTGIMLLPLFLEQLEKSLKKVCLKLLNLYSFHTFATASNIGIKTNFIKPT